MKKSILVLFFILFLAACGGSEESTEEASATPEPEKEETSADAVEEESEDEPVTLETDESEFETNQEAIATITGTTEPEAELTLTYDKMGLGNSEDIEIEEVPVDEDGDFSVEVDWQTDYTFTAEKDGKKDNEVTVSVTHSQEATDHIDEQNEVTETELGTGTFYVGEDIAPGRYVVRTEESGGNFGVWDVAGSLKTNEIIGEKENRVNDVTVTLESGDEIQIKGINSVTFLPKE